MREILSTYNCVKWTRVYTYSAAYTIFFINICYQSFIHFTFEPSTLNIKFIQNPYRIFKKIFYDEDTWNANNFNPSEYKNCFVKLIVVNKNNSIWLDRIIERLYDSGIHDLKIIDDTVMDQEEVGGVEHEDTLTILNKYIEQMDDKLDKPELKSIMKSIYLEACEAQ